MRTFVDLLLAIQRRRSDVALASVAPITGIELAKGYYLQHWAGGNRDRMRVIRSLQNRAPFRDVLPENAGAGADYTHRGRPAQGLGAAHLMDGMAVSLVLGAEWDDAHVELLLELVAEMPDGQLDLRAEPVHVRHSSTPAHLDVHGEFFQRSGLRALTDPFELWTDRESYFPHLTFLPRVADDLKMLPADWVRPVAEELARLESAISTWDPFGKPFPKWESKVTPESETRKRLCTFADVDGRLRTFDLHARFTPRAGRLHFRLDPESRSAIIAYIGQKILD